MTEELTNTALCAIETIEDILSQEGLPPHAARILGLLMMLEEPVAFSDLATRLKISRGSASQNTSYLESRGIIERIKFPSDRRDHFRVRDDAAEALLARANARRDRMIDRIDILINSPGFSATQLGRLNGMQDFLHATQRAADTLASELAKTKEKQT